MFAAPIGEQLEGFRAVRAAIDARPAGASPHLSGAYLDRVRLLDGRRASARRAVRRFAAAYAEAGADEIGLADTVGYATPPLIKTDCRRRVRARPRPDNELATASA